MNSRKVETSSTRIHLFSKAIYYGAGKKENGVEKQSLRKAKTVFNLTPFNLVESTLE
jgi:hypothetical protein